MKLALISILFLITSSLFGQSKWAMVGEYQHSSFMYSYTLILKDSENYETIETTCLGKETTIGTWRIQGQAIRLSPTKKIRTVQSYEKPQEQMIINSTEKVIVIETRDLLTLENAEDLSLKRINKEL